MNKLSRTTVKLIAITQILALILLAACSSDGVATLGVTADSVNMSNICHATGDPASPYEEITVTNDIYPVPANGCPTSPVEIVNGKVTICHATGSETNPYNKIMVSANGLNGHGMHAGDIIIAPDGDCPASPVVLGNDKITICHATGSKKNPYNEITVSVNGLNGHDKHSDDIIPAPAGGCPTAKP